MYRTGQWSTGGVVSKTERTLTPYCITDGYPNLIYCQLDHMEVYGVNGLMEHANDLLINKERQLKQKDAVIAELKKGLEYYGDDSNWWSDDDEGEYVVIRKQDWSKNHFAEDIHCGGKNARETLKRIEELQTEQGGE